MVIDKQIMKEKYMLKIYGKIDLEIIIMKCDQNYRQLHKD